MAIAPRRQTGPGRPRAGDSEQTRRTIIAAAEHTFGEYGFRAASIERIGAQAGVATSVLYHYARDKAQLWAMAVRVAAEDLSRRYEAVIEDRNFDERVEELLGLMLWMYRHEGSRMIFIASRRQEIARYPELSAEIDPTWRFTGPLIDRIVSDALAAGDLPPTTSFDATCRALRVLFDGIAHAAAAREPEEEFASQIEAAADLFRAYRQAL